MATTAPALPVTLQEITQATLRPILALEVAESQRNLVAPNAVSVAEAYFEREHAWLRAIYAGDTPVGFVMLYVEPENAVYYLWRFMIDARYQRMGYGARAVELVIEHVRGQPNAAALGVSVVPSDNSALAFYHRFGFRETGEIEHGEIVMKLDLDGTTP